MLIMKKFDLGTLIFVYFLSLTYNVVYQCAVDHYCGTFQIRNCIFIMQTIKKFFDKRAKIYPGT